MPKENTHLYFANRISEKIEDQNLKSAIKNNLDYFYLGSITPDVFYYGKGEKIVEISEFFHGEYNPLLPPPYQGGEIIPLLYKEPCVARGSAGGTGAGGGISPDFIFSLGILTHVLLDDVFHPVIESLSGDYYDPDPVKRKEAMYLHRHLETRLDKQVNSAFFCDKLINLEILDPINFLKDLAEKFQVSRLEIQKTYAGHKKNNKLFRNNLLFNVAHFLNKAKIINRKPDLALFYGNLKKDKRGIEDIDVDALFKQAEVDFYNFLSDNFIKKQNKYL